MVLGAVAAGIVGRAGEAVLLAGEQHHPDGSARDEARGAQQPHRLHHRDAAGAVVGCARPDVPRVDVGAEQDDLLRQLAAAQLADDVCARRVRQRPRPERQRDLDRPAARQACQEVRVLDGHRRGGNLAYSGLVAQRAGVRRAQADRRHRADEGGDGPAAGRLRRGVQARLHALGVARRVVLLVVRRQAMVDEGDPAIEPLPARAQLVQALERRDRCAQGAACADAAAETEQRQRPIDGPHDAPPFGPAHPVRHPHRLEADGVEAVLAHAVRRPRDRVRERRRAGDAWPVPVDQLRQTVPPDVGRALRRPGDARGRLGRVGDQLRRDRRRAARLDAGGGAAARRGRECDGCQARPRQTRDGGPGGEHQPRDTTARKALLKRSMSAVLPIDTRTCVGHTGQGRPT